MISDRADFLVVLERSDAVTWLSLRNAPEVHIVAVDQLNTYDVLATDDVVFTQGAYDAFVGGTASAGGDREDPGRRRPPEQPAATERSANAPAAEGEGPAEERRRTQGLRGQGHASPGLYLTSPTPGYDATAPSSSSRPPRTPRPPV